MKFCAIFALFAAVNTVKITTSNSLEGSATGVNWGNITGKLKAQDKLAQLSQGTALSQLSNTGYALGQVHM